MVNVPVVDDGRTLGVLNLLDAEGAYDETSVASSLLLATLSVHALRSWRDASATSTPPEPHP